LALSAALALPSISAAEPDVKAILQRSVAASEQDFRAAPQYNYKEHDKTSSGNKTYVVTMLDGSPYQRLIAVNGEPLSTAQAAAELKKQRQAQAQRHAESSAQRKRRIAKYEQGRSRDHQMMAQLNKAFNFTMTGEETVRGFKVWHLKATPRAGYRPPNLQSQVLKGMEGELWIDQTSYRWVKVLAKVIHPVTIDGFLARVQPGTQFQVEKSPVGNGIWQITHFSMHSRAKVLLLVTRTDSEDDTFYDFEKAQAR
jgi:hypothetical protein